MFFTKTEYEYEVRLCGLRLAWLHKSGKKKDKERTLKRIAALYKDAKTEQAVAQLNGFRQRYGTDDLVRSLPAAHLARAQGIKDESIEKAAVIFERLEANRKSGKLEAYLKGKTVALVGNGPSEVGKKSGAAIDAHDVVVRMNDFQITDEHKDDYGSRVDVFVRNMSVLNCLNVDKLSIVPYVVVISDLWQHIIAPDSVALWLKIYYDAVVNGTNHITFYSEELVELKKRYPKNPTAGLRTIWKLYSVNGHVERESLYGFSFKKSSVKADYHYFKTVFDERWAKSSNLQHDLAAESDFILKLTGGKT